MRNPIVFVGLPVRYTPHADHDFLSEFADIGLAATVGRVHPDGSADLMVMVPNKEPHWQDQVPFGTGPHTFTHVGPEQSQRDSVEIPDTADMTSEVSTAAPGAPPADVAPDTDAPPAQPEVPAAA